MIEEKTWDDTPEDEARHDVTSEADAYAIADIQYPGKFGVFYQNERPSKNTLEQQLIDSSQEKIAGADARELLQKRFALMK